MNATLKAPLARAVACLAMLALLIGAAAPSQAAVLTYTFANALIGTEPAAFIPPAAQPLFFSSTPASLVTVAVAGLVANPAPPPAFVGSTLHRNFQGIGIFSTSGDDPEIESVTLTEFLVVAFSQPVPLAGATFGRVGLDDDFGVYVDGAGTPAVEMAIPGGSAADDAFVTLPFPLYGTVFTFTVHRTNPGTDDFKIAAVYVVPEPSALLLAGTATVGLVAGACWRRNRRRPV
jgi:hypothetical protein